MVTIDHLGIAVRDLAAAKGLYELLGLRVVSEETVEHEKVKVAMIPVGESRVELLEATSEDSPVGRFIARRGEGIHHIALSVPDLSATVEQLKKNGTRLISDEIKVGAGGHLYVFIHPASAGGVLIELCEDPPTGV
ncbi:MAG: methylmalonyl-CoA epimerase [Terriglobales bacterium]